MPHPESEHGLRVQLATALRDAERLEGTLASAFGDLRESEKRADAAESALAAASARADAAEANLQRGYDVCSKHLESLAAARRECADFRTLLDRALTVIVDHAAGETVLIENIRKALSAPAAAAGEEGKHG